MNAELEFLPLNKNVKILNSHESGIFALEKPAGTLSQPNFSGIAAAKNALLVADFSEKQECFFVRKKDGKIQKIWLLNRLDSPTSGVVLLSTNFEIYKLCRAAFQNHKVEKTYFALVFGNAPENEFWRNFLVTKRNPLRSEIVFSKTRNAEIAECEAKKIRGNGKISLVELSPKTGKSHQLRVQCAFNKIPIVGDKTYGDFQKNKNFAEAAGTSRLFLHAAGTKISLLRGNEKIDFSAISSLPREFSNALNSPLAK